MSYGTMRSSAARAVNHVLSLSDHVVTAPQFSYGAPSPMAVPVTEMSAIGTARLFVQGRHIGLLRSMKNYRKIIEGVSNLSSTDAGAPDRMYSTTSTCMY